MSDIEHRLIEISDRLIETRVATGLSLREFADQLRVSSSVWQHYEEGKRQLNVGLLIALHEQFGVSLDWLVLGELS